MVPTLQRGNPSLDAPASRVCDDPATPVYPPTETGRRASQEAFPRGSVGTITPPAHGSHAPAWEPTLESSPGGRGGFPSRRTTESRFQATSLILLRRILPPFLLVPSPARRERVRERVGGSIKCFATFSSHPHPGPLPPCGRGRKGSSGRYHPNESSTAKDATDLQLSTNSMGFCRSRGGGSPDESMTWMPAFAGMTNKPALP